MHFDPNSLFLIVCQSWREGNETCSKAWNDRTTLSTCTPWSPKASAEQLCCHYSNTTNAFNQKQVPDSKTAVAHAPSVHPNPISVTKLPTTNISLPELISHLCQIIITSLISLSRHLFTPSNKLRPQIPNHIPLPPSPSPRKNQLLLPTRTSRPEIRISIWTDRAVVDIFCVFSV